MQHRRIRRKDKSSSQVRTLKVKNRATRADISRQQSDEEVFGPAAAASSSIIKTPYDLHGLHIVHEKSNTLRQCIQAYVTNIAMNGFRVVPIAEGVEPSTAEADILQSFIDSPNTEESLVGLHASHVTNYEKYGFAYIEVLRDKSGRPTILKKVKSSSVKVMTRDDKVTPVVMHIERGGKRKRVVEQRRFRRYVQNTGGSAVYFKEFGDPRNMNYKTGRYESDTSKVPEPLKATEIMHNKQESEDVYGIPRWISQLPAILGSREAEEVNLRYFEDNTVPPMIMSVAGGRLTKQSFQDMRDILEGKGLGKERQNQIILVEAVPEVADVDGKGSVTLQVDKLTDSRQSDGLFKDYDESNQAKIRSSFRLPPVFLGMSQDMTFATANVSAYLAEFQVFSPERFMHDEFYNKKFINHANGLNLRTVKLESKGPTTTNPESIVKTLTALNVMGGVTPRTSIDIVNETMQLSIPNYPEKKTEGWMPWMDQPISLSLREAKTQQTGEGDNLDDEQGIKDSDIKDREHEGDVLPKNVENGKQ